MAETTQRQKLKQERVRHAFIATAARIIDQEGVEAITIRRVSDEAGYTLATLYKYFASLDALLWQARLSLIAMVVEHFHPAKSREVADWDDFKHELSGFMAYFIQHPSVFRFLYCHHLDPQYKPENPSGDSVQLALVMEPMLRFLQAKGGALAGDGLSVSLYTLMGLLCLFIGGNDNLGIADIDSSLDSLCLILRNAFTTSQTQGVKR